MLLNNRGLASRISNKKRFIAASPPAAPGATIYNISDGGTGTATVTNTGGNNYEVSSAQFNKDLLISSGLALLGTRTATDASITITTTASALRVGLGIRDAAGNYMALGWQDNGWLVARSNYAGGPTGNVTLGLPAYTTGDVLNFSFFVLYDKLYITVSKNGGTRQAFGFVGIPQSAEIYWHIYDVTTAAHVTFNVTAATGTEYTDNWSIIGSDAPGGWVERLAPAGFTAGRVSSAARFWKNPSSDLFYTNINLSPPLSASDPTVFKQYVDIATGNNSNAGTSSAPLKSIGAAIANAGNGSRAAIFVKGGLYDFVNCWKGSTSSPSLLQVTSWDGNPVISSMHDSGLTWTLDTGTTYTATFADQVIDVADAGNLTSDGDYTMFSLAASAAACRSTLNSYFVTGTTIYVNAGRTPDFNIRVYKRKSDATRDRNGSGFAGGTIYQQDIRFEGGEAAWWTDTNTNPSTEKQTIYSRRCQFKYSSSNLGCGLYLNGDVLGISQECIASWNAIDGFHYNPISGSLASTAIEIDCIARWNGRGGDPANNSSSNHSGPSIRIRTQVGYGDYGHSEHRGIHDIKDSTVSEVSRSWHMGITSHDSRNGYANFAVTTGTGGAPLMWNDNCTSYGATYDRESGTGCTMYNANFTGSATDTGAGTITTYTP